MLFKILYLAPLVLLLSSRSHAQDLSDLPSCAQSPALSGIGSTGCQANDFACLCKDNAFINSALAGAEKQCSQADLQKVIAFAQQICGSVGVSLSISATAQGSGTASAITNTNTPTSAPATVTTSSLVSQEATGSSKAAAATGKASGTAGGGAATAGARGRGKVGGLVWGGVVLGLGLGLGVGV